MNDRQLTKLQLQKKLGNSLKRYNRELDVLNKLIYSLEHSRNEKHIRLMKLKITKQEKLIEKNKNKCLLISEQLSNLK